MKRMEKGGKKFDDRIAYASTEMLLCQTEWKELLKDFLKFMYCANLLN